MATGRPRFRLGLRLAIALCLGTVAIVAAAGTYNLHMQRVHLLEIVNTAGDRIVETIRTSTRDAMLRNQADEVRRIIETIGSQRGIDRIRVFDKRGNIQISTRAAEVGSLVDTNAEECYACHQRNQPLDRLQRADRMRIFEGDDGSRIMGVISPIRNEEDCTGRGCHVAPEAQRLLGVLDVRLSLEDVDDDLAASQVEMTVGLIGTALAVLGLALVLSWHMVLRPVHSLTGAAARVAAGDLSATVPEHSSDEIGDLSTAWNAMVQEVRRSRDQLEASSNQLELKVMEKTAELEEAHQRILMVEKMASLGKLAAVVAHELNNPLAGIGTYAKVLEKRLGAEPQAAGADEAAAVQDTRRILRLIESESRRCGDIVRNLLLFSRTPSAEFSEQEILPLVERCTMLVGHQAELAELDVVVEVDEKLPAVSCDPSQLQQLILALLMNAIEASEPGGKVSLGATLDAATDEMILRVSDDGVGIPPEYQAKIFEPFFTTKEEGVGVGLGLAVVYGIADRHGGRCGVESAPGKGTTFVVRIPRQRPPEDEKRHPQS